MRQYPRRPCRSWTHRSRYSWYWATFGSTLTQFIFLSKRFHFFDELIQCLSDVVNSFAVGWHFWFVDFDTQHSWSVFVLVLNTLHCNGSSGNCKFRMFELMVRSMAWLVSSRSSVDRVLYYKYRRQQKLWQRAQKIRSYQQRSQNLRTTTFTGWNYRSTIRNKEN